MFFLIYIAAFVALSTVYFRLRHWRRYELVRKFPGPPTVPLFGNALMYFNKKPEDVLNFVQSMINVYGKLFRVWIGPYQVAFFSTDPKDLEVMLSSTKHITKNNLYNFLKPWLGTGLLISTGQKWHTRRKIITPTFHFKILEQFTEVFNRQGSTLVRLLQKHSTGESFNIYPFINLYALDVISESAMGIELNSQTDSGSEYVRAVSEISQIMSTRFIKVWQRIDFLFNNFVSTKKDHDRCIRVMHNFTENIIRQRREKLIEMLSKDERDAGVATKGEDEEESEFYEKKRLALLDVLLQATVDGKPLSNEDIREEVDTFMFEGHDTTTAAMTFALYAISRHPDVQKRLQQELQEVLGADRNAPVTYRHLQNLKYMELVIKETLRLYPPVPIYGRRIEEDMEINGKIIPAYCNYTMGIYFMGRDPNLYPEPEQFKPERFSLENTTEITNPFAYVPFSAGPRNCIGQKFAMLEIKSMLSKVLSHFELLPCGPEPRIIAEIVLRSQNGVHLGLKCRN
ncbi:cytochrome P450 4d2-like isoform X1 [Phlebotomus argentipes]|uniref:cytochrome P450 4d2-like isoform X1 n=1 Tax=Phlebotomus argentipes TaxID=94469 RepID=UPI0028930513|nr:cytochrome P450 4d2-like isoform X1 [Phlebotomus argentipes]XP_059617473.1 cytochrome P450 4d2-like isoform X1 [Phlebotomus argentipes]